MPFVTLQTRLTQVLNAARNLKQLSVNVIAKINMGPLDRNEVSNLKIRFTNWLSGIIANYENDTALKNYADAQFDTAFHLDVRIAAIKTLLQSGITECNTVLALNVSPLEPSATSSLKTLLQSIVDGIGE